MKIKYAILIFLMVWATAARADRFEYDGIRYVGETVRTFKVNEGGELNALHLIGDVSIEGVPGNEVVVTEKFKIDAYSEISARQILESDKAQIEQRGNTIQIVDEERSRRYTSDYEIKVPQKFNLAVHTSGGDVNLTEVSGNQKLNTSGGDIEITRASGTLKANTSGGDIRLRRVTGDLNAVTSGGDVEISECAGALIAHTSGGDIVMRENKVTGEATTSGGDIVIVRLIGKEFRAHTSGGDVKTEQTDGPLSLTTSGGDIEVNETYGPLKVHTSGGDINIRKADSNLEVSTSGGDIVAEGVTGRISARTSGGDVEAYKVLRKGVNDHAITMETSGGSVVLYLPADLPASIDAEVKLTRYSDKRGSIKSDYPLKVVRTERGSTMYITATGNINNGGSPVRLRTTNGDIRIIKISGDKK